MDRALVQKAERATHDVVAQAREPSRLLGGQRGQMSPHDLDEHQLAQPEPDAFTAGAPLPRLRDGEIDELAQRVAGRRPGGPNVEEVGQRAEQRVEGPSVATHEPAHETERLPAATVLDDDEGKLAGGHLLDEVEDFARVRAPSVGGPMDMT